jgi:beta-galactosidase
MKTNSVVMNISVLSLFVLVLSNYGWAQRVDISVNEQWRFYKANVSGAENPSFDDSSWESIELPHTWNALDGENGGNDYYRGIGWYRKHYTIGSEHLGKRVYLFFESVGIAADVYCNGVNIGHHDGAYAAFCFDITSAVIFGADNVIAVKVNNSSSLNIAPLSGDFTKWGGICRSVHLLITNPVHITPLDYASPGVYLTTTNVSSTSSNLSVKTLIRNAGATAKDVTVRATIKDADNITVGTPLTLTQSVAASTTTNFVQNTTISNPHLWDGLDDPYLYKVLVEVETDSNVVDQVEQPLGFRYYSVNSNTGFFLNGHYLDLHGVAMHEDREHKGRAISDADRQQDIELMLEMGCTWIRLSHYQHAEKIYDLADETGIILSTEIPIVDSINFSTAFVNNCKDQLRELIRQNYNHPSVFFWLLYNELTTSGSETVIQQLHDLAKEAEDPTRLTAVAHNNTSDTAAWSYISDVLGYNRYYGWYGSTATYFAAWADSIHASRGTDEIGVTEYGAGASINHHEENPSPPVTDSYWHPEEYQTYFHEVYWKAMEIRPFLWCKTIWNGFDFGVDSRSEGDRDGINDKGMVLRDRTVKKDAFYWYKANWSSTPTVYITSRRFTPRTENPTYVKVYSNCDNVELFINGVSKGVLTSTDHIYKWTSALTLTGGANEIKAIGRIGASEYTDVCNWDLGTPPPVKKKLTMSVSAVTASGFQTGNTPENTIDGNMTTRWSCQGVGSWIKYDLGFVREIQKIKIAFYNGNSRRAYFDIHVSDDNSTWTPVLTGGISSGTTIDFEEFDFPDTSARYLRITGNGNSGSNWDWNSYCEVEICGPLLCSDVLACGLKLDADLSGPAGTPDCRINLYDLAVMAADWMQSDIPAGGADLSGPAGVPDNHVDFYDLAVMAADWMECNDPACD